MNSGTLFSNLASRAHSSRAARLAACVAIFVVCATVMSLAQTSPLAITVTGPYAFKDTPVVPTYEVTVTNTSTAIVSSIALNHMLSSTDGAYLIAAQPSQGTCELGGQGITSLSCSVGNLDPGASTTMNVEAQMVSGDITFSSSASGIDGSGAAFSTAPAQRTTVHGNPPAGTPVVSISFSANPIPKDLVGGRTGTLNWNLQNSTGIRANKLVLAMVIDSRFRISSSVVTGSDSTDPVSCSAPTPGDPGTNIVSCNIEYLGGSSSGSGSGGSGGSGGGSGSGSGGSGPITQLQVTVNYTSPIVSTQTTLMATGYLSFDGSDSSNPIATGQVRVKP